MKRLIAFLMSKPLDHEVYRKVNATGLTRLLYSMPWWVFFSLMGAILLVLWLKP